MRPDELEARMRRLECFHGLRVPDGAWCVVRADGRSFSRLTAELDKPFDARFHAWMVETARTLLAETQGVYAYTESDEISVLLRRETELFGREVEKLVSVSAGVASAAFTRASGLVGHFDARLCVAATDEQVVDYFRWRQADATRCALNGWCYWTLRQEGRSAAAAAAELAGASIGGKNELLFRRGVNFNDLPAWRGGGPGWRGGGSRRRA